MGPKLCGLFLYGATHTASNRQSPLRCAPGPASGASGNSTPTPSGISPCDWGDTEPQNVFRSPPPRDVPSTDPWNSPIAMAPPPEPEPKRAFGASPASGAFLEPAWPSKRVPLSSGIDPSTGKPSLRNTRSSWQQPTGSTGSSTARWRVGVASQAAPGFHRVSWSQGTMFRLLMRRSIIWPSFHVSTNFFRVLASTAVGAR